MTVSWCHTEKSTRFVIVKYRVSTVQLDWLLLISLRLFLFSMKINKIRMKDYFCTF